MSGKRLTIIYFLLLLLVAVGHYLGWLTAPENLGRFFLNQTGQSLYNINLSWQDFRNRLSSSRQLSDANQSCIARLRKLAYNQAELQLLREENTQLRQQLNFLKNRRAFIVADVVGKGSEPSSSLLIINVGASRGIKIDQPVIAGEGFLIGRVVKTEDNRTWVRLINDNQSKIAATVLNNNKTAGVLTGEHGLSIRLTLVPQNEILSPEDLVITSGLEGNLPRGLILGQVETVTKEPYEPFQNAAIKPLLNLQQLSIVTILTD